MHDGDIPSNETWIKIGGDKGGCSFKMNFQIVNTPKPNSPKHTCIFAAVEAPDSIINLHVTLNRYKDQMEVLNGAQWRYERTVNTHTHTLMTGFGKTLRMGFFLKIECCTVDKLYHRANPCSSLRPIARLVVEIQRFVCDRTTHPIIEKLQSKGIAMHA